MTIRALNVAIAAGGRVEGELASSIGSNVKALADIDGHSLLERTIAAAASIGARRIVVLGNDEVARRCDSRVERVIPDSGDGATNILSCLRAYSNDASCSATLLLSSDMPYLNPVHLADFIERSEPETIAMPLCGIDAYRRRFPEGPPNGVRIGDSHIVNGGALLVPHRALARVATSAQMFFNARKSPARMAMLAGLPMLVAYVLRRATIEMLERRASHVLQCHSRAIRDCAPELCFDVDSLPEYRYACEHR